MLFYIFLYLICIGLVFICTRIELKKQKKVLLFIVFILSFFSGIRYGIGTDYFYTYYPQYLSVLSGGESYQANFDLGVKIIFLVCSKLQLGFNFSLFIVSFLTFSFLFLGTYNFVKKDNISLMVVTICILLFYYQLSFNIIRQVLAFSTLFFAVSIDITMDKSRRKYFYMIILSILALLFHKTSIIFIVFYLFKFFFSQRKYLLVQIILLVTLAYFTIFNERLAPILTYLNISSMLPYLKNISLDLSAGYLIRIIPFILTIFILRKDIGCNKTLYLFSFLVFVGYIFKLLGYNTASKDLIYQASFTQADRISYFFLVFQLYIYGYLFSGLKNKGKNNVYTILKVAVLALIIFVWVYDYGINNINETIPYKSIFG